jgi:hypothetical protein
MARSYNIALLAGSLDFVDYDMGVSIVRAFTRIGGHNITHINFREIYELNGPNKAVGIIESELRKNDVDIIIYFLSNDYEFPIEFFSGLRKHYFMVMRIGDDETRFDKSTRYYSQAFDLVNPLSEVLVKRYALYGVDAFSSHPGYDVRSMKNPSCEKKHDVCFIGVVGNKVDREEYLSYLVENKIDIKIYGYGTQGGIVSRDKMIKLYGSSRIGLELTGIATNAGLDKDITINRRIKQVKGRSREIALTGAFVLSEYAPGIEDIFHIGSEIDVFRDQDEMLKKISYYLENEDQREAMARKAFKRALHDCDEVEVWKKNLEMIGNRLEIKNSATWNKNTRIYKDPIFKRAYSSFHLFKMLESIKKLKLRLAVEELGIYLKYPIIDGGVFFFYGKRLLANISWLRNSVRKIKKLLSHENKV